MINPYIETIYLLILRDGCKISTMKTDQMDDSYFVYIYRTRGKEEHLVKHFYLYPKET